MHWLRYRDVAKPDRLQRVEVRFINKISLPDDVLDLGFDTARYLQFGVDHPAGLPQTLEGHFVQARLPWAADMKVDIASAFDISDLSGRGPGLILDIDVWRSMDTPLATSTPNDWNRQALDDFRRAKNDVFEACITDATNELIR